MSIYKFSIKDFKTQIHIFIFILYISMISISYKIIDLGHLQYLNIFKLLKLHFTTHTANDSK
jgi:hypothetical protein